MARKRTVITCGCRRCSWGMHHSSWGRSLMQDTVQALRHQTKIALRKGDYEKAQDIIVVSAGYLD
jgi:hypothetical protein